MLLTTTAPAASEPVAAHDDIKTRWGRVSRLLVGCCLDDPRLVDQVADEHVAPGPERDVLRLARRRARAGLDASLAGILAGAGDEEIARAGGRAHLLALAAEPFLLADFPRYHAEARQLAVSDRIRRAVGNGGLSPEDLRRLAGELEEANRTGGLALEAGPDTSWDPIDIVAADTAQPAPPQILRASAGGGAVFYRGTRHMVSAVPEGLKSWVGLAASAEVIQGGGKVVWIDFDGMGPGACLERLEALGLAGEQISTGFLYIAPQTPLNASTRERVDAMTAEHSPALVVVDAWDPGLVLFGMKTSAAEDIETFVQQVVVPFQRAGAAVLILDHVVKDPEQRGRWSIGSQRKVGSVEVHIGLEMGEKDRLTRTTAATVRLVAHKDRPGWHERGPDLTIGAMTFTPSEGRVHWTLELGRDKTQAVHASRQFRPTGLMERISRWLEVQSGPATKALIEEEIRGKREYVRAAISHLISEGYIAAEDGPRNAKLHRFIKRYREADDPLDEHGEPKDHATSPHLAPPRPDLAPGEVDDLAPPPYPAYRRAGRGEVSPGRGGEVTSPRSEDTPPEPPSLPGLEAEPARFDPDSDIPF